MQYGANKLRGNWYMELLGKIDSKPVTGKDRTAGKGQEVSKQAAHDKGQPTPTMQARQVQGKQLTFSAVCYLIANAPGIKGVALGALLCIGSLSAKLGDCCAHKWQDNLCTRRVLHVCCTQEQPHRPMQCARSLCQMYTRGTLSQIRTVIWTRSEVLTPAGPSLHVDKHVSGVVAETGLIGHRRG